VSYWEMWCAQQEHGFDEPIGSGIKQQYLMDSRVTVAEFQTTKVSSPEASLYGTLAT
jgi:hypothetical protein